MKERKLKRIVEETVGQLRLASLDMDSSMPVGTKTEPLIEGGKKEGFEAKMEEGTRNAARKREQQIRFSESQFTALDQYKKELDKERNARKKAEERQREMMYLVKGYSKQLKEMEKGNQKQLKEMRKDYQEQVKKMERKYQKLKVSIKKKEEKRKGEMASVKTILKAFAYRVGLSCYGASVKEIAKSSKKKLKEMSQNGGRYIEENAK